MGNNVPRAGRALPEQIYGVLGHPLAQSMSPKLHTWALARHGVPGLYTAWDTPPEGLAAFMRAFRETPCAGASVTIPHKESVIPFLDGLTATAKAVGAVNTLFWENGKLMGHNTDMEGFLAPLSGFATPGTALVLGAGGAARAILAALASLGTGKAANPARDNTPRVVIAARSRAKAETLADDFAAAIPALAACSWEERLAYAPPRDGTDFWVINTTPLGMRGKAEGESPLPADWFAAREPERCLAYDLVYNPLETAFLAQAKNAGWRVRDGLDMFVAQAAAQFRLWTGKAMPAREARELLCGTGTDA